MITSIKMENFKSFEAPAALNMISSTKIRGKIDHRVNIGNTKLLKYAIIYGANASGKTNLVDCFRLFKDTLREAVPVWATGYYCKNHEENRGKDTSTELRFSIDNKFYAYGFTAVLSERRITGEWLYRLYQNGNAKRIFERDLHQGNTFTSDLKVTGTEKQRFDTYQKDFEGNTTGLFLTEMNRNKKIDVSSKLIEFKTVYHWLIHHIVIFTPNAPITDFRYYYNAENLNLVNDLIRTFDTGISNIAIEEIDIAELSKMLPKEIFDDVMENIHKQMESGNRYPVRMSMRSATRFFSIAMDRAGEPTITTIKLHHGKSFYDFRFEDESDGTRRLFDLIDMILMKDDDTVFVVDELERSLHPKLTAHFLETFNNRHAGRKIQLIFTTHEASIMDQSLFRRDEIWFVERSGDNNSTIYPLDRFKERYDKVLSKAYLEGRYGAIPVFSDFKFKEE